MKKNLFSVAFSFCLFAFSSSSAQSAKKFTGNFSNGMNGDKISFVLSADGKTIKDVTFSGYWRCSGRLEQTTVGPEKGFAVRNGKINGVVVDSPNGGATARRFELHGALKGKSAVGTFRMNINALGCDKYVLKWTAATN